VIYVSNFGNHSVTVYASTARANHAPLRRIAGPRTALAGPVGLALDARNHLYVANRTGGVVTVYGPTADGNAAPLRMLRPSGNAYVLAVAVGAEGDVFAATCARSAHGGAPSLVHFAAGADESDYAIAGPHTGLTCPVGLALHPGGRLLVANALGGVVSAFAAGAAGDTSPLWSFTAATSSTRGIACSADTLLVTGPGIYLYPVAAPPPRRPVAVLGPSPSLPLRYASGVAIDARAAAPTVCVADYAARALHVIRTAGVAPCLGLAESSVIEGTATGLDGPVGVVCAP